MKLSCAQQAPDREDLLPSKVSNDFLSRKSCDFVESCLAALLTVTLVTKTCARGTQCTGFSSTMPMFSEGVSKALLNSPLLGYWGNVEKWRCRKAHASKSR